MPGVRNDFSLPRQHSMVHYEKRIWDFGAPNGLCSSITESKHIKAVKEPWRRSNRYGALGQMLLTNQRMDKLAISRVMFNDRGMLQESCLREAQAAAGRFVPLCLLYHALILIIGIDPSINARPVRGKGRRALRKPSEKDEDVLDGPRIAGSVVLSSVVRAYVPLCGLANHI